MEWLHLQYLVIHLTFMKTPHEKPVKPEMVNRCAESDRKEGGKGEVKLIFAATHVPHSLGPLRGSALLRWNIRR
jgi:hypothetical protein